MFSCLVYCFLFCAHVCLCIRVDFECCNCPRGHTFEDLKTLKEHKYCMLLFPITLNAHYCLAKLMLLVGFPLCYLPCDCYTQKFGNLFSRQLLVLYTFQKEKCFQVFYEKF